MKKALIIALSIVTVICLGLDVWYYFILKNGKDKIISDTFIVGEQTVTRLDEVTGEEITESKYFCEVNIYDDVYEIKFNNLLDENKTHFYSQGIQFIASGNKLDFTAEYNKIVKTEKIESKKDNNFFDNYSTGRYNYYNRLLSNIKYTNLSYQTYAEDPFGNSYDSTNPVTDNYFFKIDLDGKIYGMTFNTDYAEFNQNSNLYLGTTKQDYMDFGTIFGNGRVNDTIYEFREADIFFFAEEIYNSVISSSLKEGAKEKVVYMEFPDIFNYYEFENGQYKEDKVKTDLASKITAKIKNYYGIKITFNEGKMKSASQSLFKMVNGNANYSNGELTPSDYFTGKTLIKVTENDFEWIATENSGEYLFKLSDNFKSIYSNYNNSSLLLYVEIDEAYLNSCNIKFAGFTAETFKEFNLYKANIKTVTGELREVTYA